MKTILKSLVFYKTMRNTYGWSRTFHCNIRTHSFYLFGLIGTSIRTGQKDANTRTSRHAVRLAIFYDNLSNQDARSYILGFSNGGCSSL